MKKAVIGIGLMISGTIGVSTQEICDAIFAANDWLTSSGGPNLVFGFSVAVIIGGVILCVLALMNRDDEGE